MSRVGSKNTTPEMRVRRATHALGLRFRLHRKDLPGRPDLAFAKHRVVIFVHGCFWHRHTDCPKASNPKSRENYWHAKFEANVERDARAVSRLEERGWRVETIWECETKIPTQLSQRLHTVFSKMETNAP